MGRRPPDEPRRAATPLELFRPDQARLAVAALVTFKVLRRERRAAH